MGKVQEGTGRGTSSVPRNWIGVYGYYVWDGIQPYCVIDSLTYGVGEVEWRTPGGGIRKLGLRPLWPDAERERSYQDFYSQLAESVRKVGFRTPVLIYRINGKDYCRYGASRLHVARKLNVQAVPAIVCDFSFGQWDPANWVPVNSPHKVMEALGDPVSVGTFEVSHERIDLHNVVPWGVD